MEAKGILLIGSQFSSYLSKLLDSFVTSRWRLEWSQRWGEQSGASIQGFQVLIWNKRRMKRGILKGVFWITLFG